MSLETSRRSQRHPPPPPPPPPTHTLTYVLRTRAYRRAASLAALAALIALAGLFAAGTAEAQDTIKLVGNTGRADHTPTDPEANLLDDADSLFQVFDTASHPGGYLLTHLNLEIRSSGTNPTYSVTIHENAAGNPGRIKGTLTNPTSLSTSFSLAQFEAPHAGIRLAPAKSYFVQVSGSGVQLQLTNSVDGDQVWPRAWRIDPGYRKGNTHLPDANFKMDLYGRVLPVPQPSAAAEAPGADVVLLSNSDTGSTSSYARAQRLTTGPERVDLKGVRMQASFGLLTRMSVAIWLYWNDNPTNRVCQFDDGGTNLLWQAGTVTFTPIGTCTLREDTALPEGSVYWVVVNALSSAQHTLAPTSNDAERRSYALGSGSTSSYGYSFGETRYWSVDDSEWKPAVQAPLLELVIAADDAPEVVAPPLPPTKTRLTARQAQQVADQRALEPSFGQGVTVITHRERRVPVISVVPVDGKVVLDGEQ